MAERRMGVLLRASEAPHSAKVYYCHNGFRHYVRDAASVVERGYRWPQDLTHVPNDVLDAFRPGRPLSRQWAASVRSCPPRENVLDMREIAVSCLYGNGIEIGAGSSPLPIPLNCEVSYVDLFDGEELAKHRYDGQLLNDIVVPDVIASFDDLSPIAEASVDFVASCHVIEHTRDPIGAIAGAWRKLRPGGSVVLVVPEHTRTFDRFRQLTPLEHLVQDFRQPDPTRQCDQSHFREFYALALPAAPEQFETTWYERWLEAVPIHYHTWTHHSFGSMVEWMDTNGALPELAEVWSQPPLAEETGCIEFWYVLRKRGEAPGESK